MKHVIYVKKQMYRELLTCELFQLARDHLPAAQCLHLQRSTEKEPLKSQGDEFPAVAGKDEHAGIGGYFKENSKLFAWIFVRLDFTQHWSKRILS